MEKLIIPEQDIINALCLYTARNKEINPEVVEIELMYDDDHGFSAEAYWNGRKQVYVMINIIEALRLWLEESLNRDPYSGIELVLNDEEGIIAQIS